MEDTEGRKANLLFANTASPESCSQGPENLLGSDALLPLIHKWNLEEKGDKMLRQYAYVLLSQSPCAARRL